MSHVLDGPSSLNLVVACLASPHLQAQVPALPPTEEELEGEAAHWVAMRYAAGYGRELPVGSKFKSRHREWEVDGDMVTGAMMYVNALGGPHSTLRLEDPVDIPRIYPSNYYGTPDGWRFFPQYNFPAELRLPRSTIKLLRVADYKYGHRFVEVFESYQLSAYASGVMHRLQLTDNDDDLWVELILVQPRSYHREGPVRIWRGPAHMLRATLNVAKSAVTESRDTPHPPARTSEHCVDCKARHVCKTLQYATQTLIDFSTTAEVVEMPAEAMGQELALVEDAIQRLEARQTGLAAQAEALLRQGRPVAFYHMSPGQSRLTYLDNVTAEEITSFGDLIGIDLRKPQTLKEKLVTPTQAIALGIAPDVMKSYASRPPAAFKLTRDNSITARKVFAK